MSSISPSKLVRSMVVVSLLAATLASAGAALADTGDASTLDMRGSTTVFPIVNEAQTQFKSDYPSTNFVISQGGSGVGQSFILAGTIDIAMSSSSCSDANAGLNGAGPATTNCNALTKTTIGRDGITMIVKNGSCMANSSSKDLSKDQIANIYNGSITDWNTIYSNCPVGSTIIPRARVTSSGTRASILDILKNNGTPKLTSDLESATITASGYGRLAENTDMQNAIINDSTGRMIGYVGLAFDASVTDLKVGGIVSSVDTVSNGTYPLGRNLFLFTLPSAKQRILDYLAWVQSSKGQAVVEDSGYVTISTPAKDYDVNGDRSVNVGDLVAVGGVWNTSGPSHWWIRQDANRDGTISVGDLVFIGSHWNQTY
jgi:phosphate transport system substrate-binding protein